MLDDEPVVALIHANPLAAQVAHDAFTEVFPEARLWHLLDDRLLQDLEDSRSLGPRLYQRMLRLIDHAFSSHAQAVQLTCSAYGPVVDIARKLWAEPVRKPDEAMYEHVADMGVRRVAVVASTSAALPPAVAQLEAAATRRGNRIEVETVLCEAAAGITGDRVALGDVLRAALADVGADAVALAQYSLSSATRRLQGELGIPVVSGPFVAAEDLRAQMLEAVEWEASR